MVKSTSSLVLDDVKKVCTFRAWFSHGGDLSEWVRPERADLTGKSHHLEHQIFQVNVSESGSGGFCSGGQMSVCANEENSELAFKIQKIHSFPPLDPAERYEAEFIEGF